ncbi:uncharacterized protein [Dysidea avara]|uniref:uncharacterized protein n=1 Tax=Dysidea avara TaxID=196820 RepID=UPI003319D4BD
MADQLADQYYFFAVTPPYYEDSKLQHPAVSSGGPDSKSTSSTGVTGNVTGHTELQVLPDPEQLHVQPYVHLEPSSEARSEPVPSPARDDATGPRTPISNHMEWTQIHEQCHSSSDDLDTNMESHPSLPQKVSEVSSSDFTSPRNSSIVPASLSFQSGLTGPQSQEQVLFMNSGLHVPIDPTLPSPCTEDVEDVEDGTRLLMESGDATVATHPQTLENGSKEMTASSPPCNHYLCKRCCRERINTMLIPCRHVGLCMGCACRILRYSSVLTCRCPFCDEPVIGVEYALLT